MFFSNEWIKNVAKITVDINDIDKIYKLYGYLEIVSEEVKTRSELQVLKRLDDDFNNERYINIINKVSEKVFNSEFLDSDMKEYTDKNDVELDIINDLSQDFSRIIKSLKFTIK